MISTAKIFTTGNSQAVRLPKAFRMPGDVVYISRNETTGDVILSPKDDDQRQRNLAQLFKMIREEPMTEEFLATRSDEVRPDPFENWILPVSAKRSARSQRAKPKSKAA
jgi:antitoxin VapB